MFSKLAGRNVDGHTLYKEFKRKFDANQSLYQKFINNFDENGVVLKTDEIEDPAQNADLAKSKQAVNSSAKRASQKLLKK